MMVMLTLLCVFYLVTASLLIHGARKVFVMIVMIIMIMVTNNMIIVTIIMIIVMIVIIICTCDHPEKIMSLHHNLHSNRHHQHQDCELIVKFIISGKSGTSGALDGRNLSRPCL